MNYVMLHPPTWSPREFTALLPDPRIELREIAQAKDLVEDDRPTVFVLDPASRPAFPLDVLRAFVDSGGAIVAIGAPGEADVPDELPGELLSGFVSHPAGARQVLVSVRAGYREAAARIATARARDEAADRGREIHDLTKIGAALGSERDTRRLLDLILEKAQQITSSDAGSLYLVEATDTGAKRLRFAHTRNSSKPDVPFIEFTIPVDRTSLAGYTATTGEPLVIDDAYFLPPDVEYTINRSFDERYGYRTKSMLVMPMKDHQDEIIGVLQLINRKRNLDAKLGTAADVDREVVPYSKRTVELVTALAGQAAVAIENTQLYQEIESLFATFVDAAVFAIEQRDPITQGHSRRVANMTVFLAEVVDRVDDGPYAGRRFTRTHVDQIKYAALLHDFGKVGVREEVLQKEKKLHPLKLNLLRQRHAFVRRTLERSFWRRRAEYLEHQGRDGFAAFLAELEAAHAAELAEIDAFLEVVVRANEPTLLHSQMADNIAAYASRSYEAINGELRPLLEPEEIRFLTIPKGSLDPAERLEIERHVNHTYEFLKKLPWPDKFEQVPEIAWGHHEKLDGSGYPRRIHSGDIAIETRMMTISDIYDALTAADRPYKNAVPQDAALNIIGTEVTAGQLDGELFRLFIEGRVFEKAKPA